MSPNVDQISNEIRMGELGKKKKEKEEREREREREREVISFIAGKPTLLSYAKSLVLILFIYIL